MSTRNTVKKSFLQRWSDYQPTKSALFLTGAGAVVATMIVGFTWGDWVTGQTSRNLAWSAGNTARSALAADICVERFNAAPDAAAQLVELKAKTGATAKRQFIEAGGWATMPGQTTPDGRGANACAAALVG